MIVVTGASGELGRLVVQGLLKKVPANEIVAAVRNPQKVTNLVELGVQVRETDYDRPETLKMAFAGANTVLLISSSEVVHAVSQHRAVVDAAKKAGVGMLAYTSILRADTSRLALAAKHKATEEYIRDSGVPFAFLRNGWYLENQTASLAPAMAHGAILGSAEEGRFAAAARADYADAATAVLTSEGHANRVYELAGDKPYTLSELAAEVTKQAGKNVVYHNMPKAEYAAALTGFGLPVSLADSIADADAWAAQGELDDASHVLSGLIGRPTMPMAEAVRVALKL